MSSAALQLRRLWEQNEAARGRAWQVRSYQNSSDVYAMRRAFERIFGNRRGRVLFGRAATLAGNTDWLGLPLEEWGHLWLHGSTGSGKSYLAIALLMQLVIRGTVDARVIDLKGEISALLTDIVLPALAASIQGRRLLRRVRMIDPFGSSPPPLRITDPEPGVAREIQSLNIASSLEEGVGDDLGRRMERVFVRLVSLAIELRLPLTVLSRWLQSPAFFARDAERSDDPLLREYATNGFPREQRSSLEALASRLDLLLFLPDVRRCLEAPTCLSFGDEPEPSITVIKLGGASASATRAESLLASLILGRLTRSVLSRTITPNSRPIVLLFDEAQLAIRPRDVEHFSRLFTLSRYKLCTLVLCNQQIGQLDPAFARLLRTNTALEAIFRCNPEDAGAIARVLPVSIDTAAGGGERAELLRRLVHLPNRSFFLWAKRLGHAAELRSPRLDMDQLRTRAATVPDSVRNSWRVTSTGTEPSATDRPSENGTAPSIRDLFGTRPNEEGGDDAFPSLG